jgi:fructose PTS system EIIA component
MVIETSAADAPEPAFPVVDVPATAETPGAILRFLLDSLKDSGKLPADHLDRFLQRLLYREELGSTSIGRGYAFPHITEAAVARPCMVAGRLPRAITWNESVREPVHTVVLAIAPPKTLLPLYERAARFIGSLNE